MCLSYFRLVFASPLGRSDILTLRPVHSIDETEERRNTLALNRESGVGLDPIPDVNESTFMMNLEATHNEDLSVPPLEADDDPASDFQNEPFLYEQDDHDDEELVEYMRAGDDQEPVNDEEEEGSVQEETMDGAMLNLSSRKRKGGPKISQHGIEYPSLPPAVIKRLAQTFAQTSGVANAKIAPDTLDALSQASDWFFEQLGDSLQAYAKHAGRKTIDESDVIALMRRYVVFYASFYSLSILCHGVQCRVYTLIYGHLFLINGWSNVVTRYTDSAKSPHPPRRFPLHKDTYLGSCSSTCGCQSQYPPRNDEPKLPTMSRERSDVGGERRSSLRLPVFTHSHPSRNVRGWFLSHHIQHD